jgi:hypothetical protein
VRRKAKSRNLTLDRKMQCFYKCVAVLSRRQRNTLTRQSRLLKIADDLGIKQFINRKDIAQLVLEAKDRQQGHQQELERAVGGPTGDAQGPTGQVLQAIEADVLHKALGSTEQGQLLHWCAAEHAGAPAHCA